MDKKRISNKLTHLDHPAAVTGRQRDSYDDGEFVWRTCTESCEILYRALKVGRLRGMVALFGWGAADADTIHAQLVEEFRPLACP